MSSGEGKEVASMANIVIEQRVIDWPQFEHLFRQDSDRRKIMGSKGTRAIRDPKDPETVVVLLEWEDLESARKFVAEWEATVPWCRFHVGEEMIVLEA
jgi:heme-degrading monooxygenase HmoA